MITSIKSVDRKAGLGLGDMIANKGCFLIDIFESGSNHLMSRQPAGWHSLDGLCCGATRSRSFQSIG